MCYEEIKVYALNEDQMERTLRFFDNAEFFFCTKRPDTITIGKKRTILSNSVGLIYEGEVIGLGKILDYRKNLYSTIQLAFSKQDYYESELAEQLFRGFIDYVTLKTYYSKIIIEVYSFNIELIKLCDRVGFQRKGILRNKVYKYGNYFDVYIYEYEED